MRQKFSTLRRLAFTGWALPQRHVCEVFSPSWSVSALRPFKSRLIFYICCFNKLTCTFNLGVVEVQHHEVRVRLWPMSGVLMKLLCSRLPKVENAGLSLTLAESVWALPQQTGGVVGLVSSSRTPQHRPWWRLWTLIWPPVCDCDHESAAYVECAS